MASSSSSLSDQDQDQGTTQPFHWHYTELDDKNFQIHGRSLLLVIILFSFLLLFTLLCLYARWVCRYRRLIISSSTTTTTTTTMATATQTDGPSSSNSSVGGLDPAIIDRLPILLHHRKTKSSSSSSSSSEAEGEGDDNETQCSICLTSFQDQEKVKVLPDCHHSYHPECVDTWLTTQSNCPLCRASLRFHHVDNSTGTLIP